MRGKTIVPFVVAAGVVLATALVALGSGGGAARPAPASMPAAESASMVRVATTGPEPRLLFGAGTGDEVLVGGVVSGGKAAVDTVDLLGGPGRGDGKFQDAGGVLPDREGWIGVDLTADAAVHWQVSDFNAALLDPGVPGNHAMWCGLFFQPCEEGQPNPGYGNSWDEALVWSWPAPAAGDSVLARITARLNHDCEPGYDYLYLEVSRAGVWESLGQWTDSNRDPESGEFVPLDVDVSFTFRSADADGGQMRVRWHGTSDPWWSDEDCLYDSEGLAQVDDITVSLDGATATWDGFEPGQPQHWLPEGTGCGDFSWIWPRLNDIDPCATDLTPQLAFIDDNIVVPGTGGTQGISWTYGPRGYAVNLSGGLGGADASIRNDAWSPVLTWPGPDFNGAVLSFDVYRHMPVSNGMFFIYRVRSSADGGVVWSGWQDGGWIFYGPRGNYERMTNDLTTLLLPDRNRLQVSLGIYDLRFQYGSGYDPTPAPYFDNVRVSAYRYDAPVISTYDWWLAQDNFPAIGTIDYANPGANSVRFDMAYSVTTEHVIRPEDGLFCYVGIVRAGAVLRGPPAMHWRLRRNPLFDPYRTATAPNPVEGRSDPLWLDYWNFDLPDTGFFFPGDVIHYYLEAQDEVAGDIGTARLPADTSGFSVFPGDPGYWPLQYPDRFTCRALPSLTAFEPGAHPPVLFWNDGGATGSPEWYGALAQLGWRQGADYDLYFTQGASANPVGSGLGGRAMASQIAGYNTMLYRCGSFSVNYTLHDGNWEANRPENDIALLDAWLTGGEKRLLMAGENLVQDLSQMGGAAVSFRNTWLGVALAYGDARSYIGNQVAPRVRPMTGNGVLPADLEFVAYGGCPIFNTFDAVQPVSSTATWLAQFLTPGGQPGTYAYPAAMRHVRLDTPTDVIYFPYDLNFVFTPTNEDPAGALPARAKVLEHILAAFGEAPASPATGVPPAAAFAVRAQPNPFNPAVTIAWEQPARGPLSIRLYDVRGRLVRVLREGEAEAGRGEARWDGRDGEGRALGSGVYFYEAVSGTQTRFGKLMLIR